MAGIKENSSNVKVNDVGENIEIIDSKEAHGIQGA